MEGVEGLPDDGPHPDDQVGRHHVHQAEVGDPVGQLDVEPGVHDDSHGLEDDEDDGQEADHRVHDVQTVGVQVNDEVGDELKEVVDEGPDAEHHGPLPEEPAAMRLDVIVSVGMTDKAEEKVEEEEAREEVEVEEQGADLDLGGVHGGRGELVDRHRDVDGDDHEAVEAGEGAREREEGRLRSADLYFN